MSSVLCEKCNKLVDDFTIWIDSGNLTGIIGKQMKVCWNCYDKITRYNPVSKSIETTNRIIIMDILKQDVFSMIDNVDDREEFKQIMKDKINKICNLVR